MNPLILKNLTCPSKSLTTQWDPMHRFCMLHPILGVNGVFLILSSSLKALNTTESNTSFILSSSSSSLLLLFCSASSFRFLLHGHNRHCHLDDEVLGIWVSNWGQIQNAAFGVTNWNSEFWRWEGMEGCFGHFTWDLGGVLIACSKAGERNWSGWEKGWLNQT